MSLTCSHCQTQNADDANFCLNCSYRISVVCPRCSRRMVSHAKFCDRCGQALGSSDPDLAAQARPSAAAVIAPRQEPTSEPRPAGTSETRRVSEEKASAAPAVPVAPSAPFSMKQPPSPDASASGSPLEKFVPEALKRKLQAAQDRGDMVGERRVVTMLFCDVKGSTAAAQHLDPEEWTEIINGAFEHMIRPIYDYEGTVARLMGDGILAFFGAPLAHEDDPHRAVLAGLDIHTYFAPYREKISRDWGIDINVRVGINTGLVVVGAVGSDLRMEYSALGDAINLAARMEQTALPGTVQVAYDTYKLVKPLFEFEELGDIEVKGKEERITAYRVLGRKVQSGRVRGIEGLHADLVGREVELQHLHDVVDDIERGVGRIAVVLGEAGLGKTRLVREMRKYYNERLGEDANWYETSSLSYENKQAYGLLQRLIRIVIGIGYDDAPRLVQKKIAGLVEDFPEDQHARMTDVLEALFGLDRSQNGGGHLDGEAFKNELLELVEAWWRMRFDKTPSVIVFDDMHWADQASVDLLEKLLHLTEELPLALICAMRVDRQSGAWQIKTVADDSHHHRYAEIPLRPLSERDSNELVNRLLAIPDIPELLRSSIIEKSDGNPFFIEEVVRTLIDNEIVVRQDRVVGGKEMRYWVATSESVDFSIPDNLQSLLSARMDRLEEATRSTLQLASVIGRNFYLRVLEAVDETSPELNKHVGTLLRLDLIRESARVPEIEYAFRNPLTQEAVYKTILLRHRREFHLRVASAIEALYGDRLESHYGLLAHHYTLAKVEEKAILYRRLAATQAIAIFAYPEAEQNLKSALALVDHENDRETHLALVEELADVCRLVRDFEVAISFYQQGLAIWEGIADGDSEVCLRLNRKIIEIATTAKWSVDAEAYLQMSAISKTAVARLEKTLNDSYSGQDNPEIVLDLVVLSLDSWRNQSPPDWKRAQQFAEASVAMAEVLQSDVLLSRSLDALATVLDGQSLLREHLQVAERRLAVALGEEFDDPREKIDAHRGMGVALMYVGEYGQAIPYLDKAEELAMRSQVPDQIANALGIKAQCYFRMDRWEDVISVESLWRDLDLRYTRERVGET